MKKIFALCFLIIPSIINAQWTQTGFQKGSVFSLHVKDNTIFAGNLAGLHRSTDNGQTWLLSIQGIDNSQGWILGHSLASNSNYMYFGNYDGLYRSSNSGLSWSKMSLTLTTPQSDAVCAIICDGATVYAGTSCGLFKSTNNGSAWTKLSNGINATQKVYALLFCNSKLYAGTEDGVYFSANNGTTFSQIGFDNTAISSLVNTPNGVVAVTFRNGVHYTNNDGANWTAVDLGQNANIPAFTAITANNSILFGTNGVISVNDDFSIHTSEGLEGKNILQLAVCGNYLFAGTNADGVWRIPLSDLTDIYGGDPAPSKFALSQNYPNPFNPSTTISYQLPVNGKVSLKIYNLLGQEVRALVNGYETAGTRQVIWDGKDHRGQSVSSGVYLYRLEAVNKAETRKMVMLR